MRKVSTNQIRAITNAIVETSNPRMVILFGSQAKGTTGVDSDIDIMVIADRPGIGTWSRRKEIGKMRQNIPPLKMPIDLLLFTTDELERWKDTTNHIIGDALREGEIIYERS